MKNNVLIFGLSDSSSLAHFYFNNDSDYNVIGFTVSGEYLPEDGLFEGKPVYDWDNINKHEELNPNSTKLFAPLYHNGMNSFRELIYNKGKEQGYSFASYISSKATVWQPNLIGENCFILEDNTIQPYTRIGNNCVLWSGNHIGHHSEVKDHNYFTSHVVLSGHCVVEPYCFLGVNSTIRNGITIAKGSLIAMGAAVTKSTEPWGVYKGTPAKKGKVLSKDLKF